MKKAGWGLALLFALTTMGTGIAAAKDQTFSGEIMDSSCADMGSHAMMLKGHGTRWHHTRSLWRSAPTGSRRQSWSNVW